MYQKYWKKEGLQHQHPPATRVATPKIGVDNQGGVWYKIDESKPLPVLARGCSHFLYLKTETIVSLAIRIKSTDEGNPLLTLASCKRSFYVRNRNYEQSVNSQQN